MQLKRKPIIPVSTSADRALPKERSEFSRVISTLKIIDVPIDKLQDATYNPRRISDHDLEELSKSLKKFKAVEPAIVNMASGREFTIVGGHQRIRAAKVLGWETFPCTFVKLSLKDEKELNVRLNRNGGEWDFDKLMDENEFNMNDLLEFGFEDFELEGLDDVVAGGDLETDSLFNPEALDAVAAKRAEGEEFDRGAANRAISPSKSAPLLSEVDPSSLVKTKKDKKTGKEIKICAACGRPLLQENLEFPNRK